MRRMLVVASRMDLLHANSPTGLTLERLNVMMTVLCLFFFCFQRQNLSCLYSRWELMETHTWKQEEVSWRDVRIELTVSEVVMKGQEGKKGSRSESGVREEQERSRREVREEKEREKQGRKREIQTPLSSFSAFRPLISCFGSRRFAPLRRFFIFSVTFIPQGKVCLFLRN